MKNVFLNDMGETDVLRNPCVFWIYIDVFLTIWKKGVIVWWNIAFKASLRQHELATKKNYFYAIVEFLLLFDVHIKKL